ncbi:MULTISPECIES: helix-turn-helix domain-containing protein [unclassified Streptomyces]|uniref:helix-turn-helix domain-containing protein n=1 Tax=unclassified Streptomyces TaxID=2593676 RepID=UPI00037D8363|nr:MULTISPECIES: helix-turn-helix transcriptional regulator [unclassified Streptomyces]MYQ79470.1 helix-turn-helix domain-containing protein [Streptomyces sp. SID4923]
MTFRPQPLSPFASTRHYFGSELRRHRERAKLSLVQLADIVNSSKSTLARIETAELMPPPDMPSCLDIAFGTDELFTGLYGLAKLEVHPDQYKRYMNFEARAEVIEQYGAQALPGLLQTEEYARTFLRCQEDLSEEVIEQRVTARMARQDRQRSANPPFRWAIIDEAVLRRQMGSRACMHQQLASLLEQVDTPDSKVQVMPFSAGLHSLLGGALTLLTLSDGTSVAYEESIEAGHLYEDPDAVKKWRRQYDVLRANSHSLAESAAMIRTAMEDYRP